VADVTLLLNHWRRDTLEDQLNAVLAASVLPKQVRVSTVDCSAVVGCVGCVGWVLEKRSTRCLAASIGVPCLYACLAFSQIACSSPCS
jgi:hypothetical protein